MPYKIIFCGTPDFAVSPLKSLIEDPRFEVIAVITQPDKKIGREQKISQPIVKREALKHNIPVLQPEKIKSIEKEIEDLSPDSIVVVAFGQLIPKNILDIPAFGCINVHASLLPKYRGATPIQSALLNGEKETGITIMKMNEKLDAGGILSQKKINILDNENSETLFNKISSLSPELLTKTLIDFFEGKITVVPQNEKEATYCKKIKREDGEISFNNETNIEIYNKFRAYTPWPQIYTEFNGKRLKVLDLENRNIEISDIKGKCQLTNNNEILIQCKKGSIRLKQVQLEGKKNMEINEFLKGHKDLIDYIFA